MWKRHATVPARSMYGGTRPSANAEGRYRPRLSITVPPDLKAAAEAAAEREGRSLSLWIEDAMRARLATDATRKKKRGAVD